MSRLRGFLLVFALASLFLVGFGTAAAQDETPDYSAFCASLEQSQVQLDAQVAQFDASVAASLAQVNALDAQLGPAYDAVLNSYRNYLNTSSVSYHTQVALAQAQLDAGFALYGC